MDLNRLFFEHQIALMQVASATNAQSRSGHELAAKGFASRIARFQQGIGASSFRLQGSCTPAGGLA